MKNISIIAGFAVLLIGCGGGGPSDVESAPSETSRVYNGAGSKWSLAIKSGGTCTLEEADSDTLIQADCENLESGFIKITVIEATGPKAPAVDSVTYGFELSGYMLPFVSFSDDKLIPTVIAGSCPSGELKHNFVVSYAKGNTESSDFDEWGTFGYWETSSESNSLTTKVYDRNGTLTDTRTHDFDMAVACSDGSLFMKGDEEHTTAYYSASGGLIWHQESTKDDRVENDFMIPYDDGVNSVNKLDGKYIGYTISGNGQDRYSSTPVDVSVSNGVFTLNRIDLEAQTTDSEVHSAFTLNAEVEGTRGLLQGIITEYDGRVASISEGLGCAVDLDAVSSGRNVIICGGMLPDGAKNKLYSAILVSK